jgi:hypothetical protein
MVQPHVGGLIEHRVAFLGPETSADLEIPDSVKARLLCYLLVSLLPDPGLTEAADSLSEMVCFYRSAPPPYRILPQSEAIAGKWGETYTRPVYPVIEED